MGINMNRGYVKLWRKIQDWDWYDDDVCYKLFTYLLMAVNLDDKQWRGVTIKMSSMVTSIANLAASIRKTPKQTRRALDKLKRAGSVASKSTNKYSIISITNYDMYQGEGQANGNSKGKQRATTKELKELKEDNTYIAQIEKLYLTHYPRKIGKSKGMKKLIKEIKTEKDFYLLEKAVKNYAKHCEVQNTEIKYIKHFSTFVSEWKDWSNYEQDDTKLDGYRENISKLWEES